MNEITYLTNKPGGSVLNTLEFLQFSGRQAVKSTVAAVQTGSDKGIN